MCAFPTTGWQFWCLCWLRQFRGMDWIIFLSTTSIYTEITLDCSDTNHGRTDQIQLPCWWTQPISHSWLTGVPVSFAFFPPLLNTLAFYKPPSFKLPLLCPFRGNAREGLLESETQLTFSSLPFFLLFLQKYKAQEDWDRGSWPLCVSWTLLFIS